MLDATALALIGHDVVALDDAELDLPTPCTGWSVTDLINHMNERHEAVIAPLFAPLDPRDDPRGGFARIAARWVVAMEQVGDVVQLPWRGAVPTERVLAIHFVDMLVHRWDLARALGRPCPTPARLTALALPIAQSTTAPGSPLNGPGGVYQPPLAQDSTRPALDNIVALLGRNPDWTPA